MRIPGHQTIMVAEDLGIDIPIDAAINFAVSEKLLDIAELGMSEILEIVSEVTGIGQESIKSKCRKLPVIRARYLFCIQANDFFNKSELARYLSRDHSTIISGMRKMKGEVEIYRNNSLNKITEQNLEIKAKIKDLIVEKIIFAALDEERRIKDAS